jgi:hypothetical protein
MWPGFGSAWGAAVKGMAGGAATRAGNFAWNMGKLGSFAARGGLGRTAQGAMIGAGAGAAWGAVSDDTSVLGGMAMGAGLGAGGMRYGGAALAHRGLGPMGAMGMGARLASNDARAAYRWGAGRASAMRAGWGARGAAATAGAGADKAAAAVVQAASAPAGATIASNAAVNPVSSSLKKNIKGLRGEELMGAVSHNMNALRMRRGSFGARKRNMDRFFAPIG